MTDTLTDPSSGAAPRAASPLAECEPRASSALEAILAAVAFTVAVAAGFGPWSPLWDLPGMRSVAPVAMLFALLVGAYLASSVSDVTRALHAWVRRHARYHVGALTGPGVLWIVVVLYSALSGLAVLSRAVAFGAYLVAPALLVAGRTTPSGRPPVRELAAIAVLWLPIEFRLLPPLPVPAPVGYDAARVVGLVDALFLFLVARPLSRVGYTFALGRRDVAVAVVAFLTYAAVALPVGLATGFIAWWPRVNGGSVLLTPLLIYVAIAVPEELLFRGLVQNLLTRWCGPARALALAAVVFGLAHLPDLRYVLLATAAGVAYGWVYQRTGRITAAAVTHTLVDAVWVTLLHR